MKTTQNLRPDSIAIIGIGCRFPGANGPGAFWQLLVNGVDAITEVPRSRFDIDKFYSPAPGVAGKISSRFGGFLDDVYHFDAEFFGISPREAESMDPQHRLLLEVAYEALEDAGLPSGCAALSGAGVFVGMMANDYLHHLYRASADIDLTLATAGSRATAAARISRALSLEGPSLTIDSDRSSSLTALHLACRSLRSGECAIALAGAANLILGPEFSIACSRSGLLSPDGRCRFGDAGSNGIGRSEGVGVLVLKRLDAAIHDGDRIYAIIRGSAVRNNGSSSPDLLHPSARGQEAVIRAALQDAGIGPEDVDYVEAHGTGTRVGDQVEIEVLGAVFGPARSSDRPCLVGSVKTNVGHAEGAAGIAGIIKTALALQHATIPKNLHLKNPNPGLALAERHLRIPTETEAWSANETAFAGVSSFGLTGSLAHIVLQQTPQCRLEEKLSSPAISDSLVVLSAPSQQGLDALAKSYQAWLRQVPETGSIGSMGYSAAKHRQHHAHRLALVASSIEKLHTQLAAYQEGREPFPGATGQARGQKQRKLAFIFPGQGGQWIGMGRSLIDAEPMFRETIALCEDAIRAEAGWSLGALLRGESDNALLEEIEFVQPALTSVMIGLAALWHSWGIQPDAVLGLSMGEAAAAYVAGALELHEAIAVVCRRSRLMKRMRGKGAIASVPLSLAEAEQWLTGYSGQLSVAMAASPSTTMISGDPAALQKFIADLGSRGVSSRQVKVDVASHSAQMDGLLEDLREQLRDLKPQNVSIPLLSTVDGMFLAGPEMDFDYWARNLRQPVLQLNTFVRLLEEGYSTFLEISPHPVIFNPLLETIQDRKSHAKVVPSLLRDEEERKSLLKSAGALYACGISPDWQALFRREDRRFLPLPTYPWQKKLYRLEAPEGQESPDYRDTSATKKTTESRPQTAAHTRVMDEIRSAAPGQRRQVLLDYLQKSLRRILLFRDDAALPCDEPLRQLGLTSLMSAEFALELQTALHQPYSATLFFNYPTLDRLADHLLPTLTLVDASIEKATPTPEPSAIAEDAPAMVRPAFSSARTKAIEPIAVIGIGCRFPGGAASPEDFWRLLHNGVDVISEVPFERWNAEDFYDSNPESPGRTCSRWGGFLDDIDRFDAGYFGISRREAEVLDPQQRLLLEVTVEALENAGHSPSPQSAANGGVFVGIMNNYDFVSVKGTFRDPSRINAHDSTGQATSAAAGRLSYTLGLQGPSVAVDTACSSSLVAVHLACQALRAGECEFAIAGGVNVILAPETTIAFSKTRMLSPTGRCKTFDARADGYVRGEGCGILVLKRLSDALRDSDNILAVIRGSAVNQDGRSSSLTAPNGLAQQAVVLRALESANVDPASVDYVEAHGTGTSLGDPIEIEALGNVLGKKRSPTHPFLVGSVKTNIGHLEAAAGVAGLVKVILSLQHEEIPPHLHLEQVNPQISLTASKAFIPTQPTPWRRGGRRRIAGVSSFGFVGTNAHIVVEEPPEAMESTLPAPVFRLLTLSARSQESLRELTGRYAHLLSQHPVEIDDLCHTANLCRTTHSSRAAFVAANVDDLRTKLQSFADATHTAQSSPPSKIAFIFTGQGSQFPGMGTQLFAAEPVFRAALERCAHIMDPLLSQGLFSLLREENPALLQQTRFAQPALFALEYALFELWRSWGIEPSAVMGHSLGECAASVAAGVMSLEQAAKLVVTRGNLMQSIKGAGGSASVFASEDFVRPFVEPYAESVVIAADNAPERVLIAGEEAPLQIVCTSLEKAGVEIRRMIGLMAAHCPMMDPILDAFESVSAMATYRPPEIPLVSTLTGRFIAYEEIGNARHWRDHIRNKVRFREGMRVLHEAGCRIFVEIGPRHTLVSLGKMCLPSPDLVWLPSLSKEKHDQEQILESLAELYVRGVPVRWEERHRPFRGRKIPLPTTVFEKTRYWPETAPKRITSQAHFATLPSSRTSAAEALLGRRLRSPLEQIQFESKIDLASLPMLEDHRVFGALIMPAAAQLVRIVKAIEKVTGRTQVQVREVFFVQPLVLCDPQESLTSHLVLTPEEEGYHFQITSVEATDEENQSEWRVNVSGQARAIRSNEAETPTAPSWDDIQDIIRSASEQHSGEDFYVLQEQRGYSLGASFRWLHRVWWNAGKALAELCPPVAVEDSSNGLPGLIDACFQVASRLQAGEYSGQIGTLVPIAVEGLRTFAGLSEMDPGPIYCRISSLPAPDEKDSVSSLIAVDQSGKPIFSISRLHLRRVEREDLLEHDPDEESLRQLDWRESYLPSRQAVDPGRWLILTDQQGTGTALAAELEKLGHEIVLVTQATAFENNGRGLRLNPARQAHFEYLADWLCKEHGRPWRGILYLWGLDTCSAHEEEKHLRESVEQPCIGLFHLAKALAKLQEVRHLSIWVVTRGAQSTERESKITAPGQALLWGLGHVITIEHPSLFGGLLDLDPQTSAGDVTRLLHELLFGDCPLQVAFRGGKRLVPYLVPLEKKRPRRSIKVRPDATYLVTGGYGALGRKVMHWLIAEGARHLALVSRRLTREQDRRWLEEIRALGVQCLPLEADVADRDALETAFAHLDRSLPPLRGVIHAAGIVEDNLIANLEWPSLARVLAPKTQGACNLHLLTKERPLDFWVVFSSVSSLIGLPGQAAYAAGNAYLDALVHHRRKQGLPALSINYGPWQGEGMSASVANDLEQRWGLVPINPDEGTAILGRVLASQTAQVWAAPLDIEILEKRSAESLQVSLLAQLAGIQKKPPSMPSLLEIKTAGNKVRSLSEQDRRNVILQHVIDTVRTVAAMNDSESIPDDARFDSLGIDSLLTLDLISALGKSLNTSIPSTIFSDCPTIERLVTYLFAKVAGQNPASTPLELESVLSIPPQPTPMSSSLALEQR